MLSDAISEHLFFKIFLGYTPAPPTLFCFLRLCIRIYYIAMHYDGDVYDHASIIYQILVAYILILINTK